MNEKQDDAVRRVTLGEIEHGRNPSTVSPEHVQLFSVYQKLQLQLAGLLLFVSLPPPPDTPPPLLSFALR